MIYYEWSYELWIYLKMFFHKHEIYLLSLIFFSLKRRWKSLSSSISPSDNIWSTRLSNLSSRATEEDEWGNKIKLILKTCLQWQPTLTGGYHSFCSVARRCKGPGTARDPQDNLLHPALAAPPKADCVELQCPYTPADSCQPINWPYT